MPLAIIDSGGGGEVELIGVVSVEEEADCSVGVDFELILSVESPVTLLNNDLIGGGAGFDPRGEGEIRFAAQGGTGASGDEVVVAIEG